MQQVRQMYNHTRHSTSLLVTSTSTRHNTPVVFQSPACPPAEKCKEVDRSITNIQLFFANTSGRIMCCRNIQKSKMQRYFSLPLYACFQLEGSDPQGSLALQLFSYCLFVTCFSPWESVIHIEFHSCRNGKGRRKRCDPLEWLVPIWTLMLPFTYFPLHSFIWHS